MATEKKEEVIKLETEIGITECWMCASPIALTTNQEKNLRQTGYDFYCPIGHINSWSKPRADALAKAQELVTALEQQVSNSAAALKVADKEISNFKKAAKKGQCPHCEKYFSDLHRHVRRQHS